MLYLTYNNTDHTDGAGAQIQRIVSIYMTAKYFTSELRIPIGYIHSPLSKLDYQGLQCLENNKSDSTQLEEYNKLFDLSSNTLPTNYSILIINTLSNRHIMDLYTKSENILIRVLYCNCIETTNPIFKISLPFPWINTNISYPIQIAVHVRRGELFVVDSSRMLPNSYYIECMSALQNLFIKKAIPFEFHIYTEVVTKQITVNPSDHGILNRISKPVVLNSSDNKLDEFSVFPNIIYHINESPIKTLIELTNSHILLASRSSFSYVASLLKKKGVVLFHPFWHSLADSWIPVRSKDDIINNEKLILDKLYI